MTNEIGPKRPTDEKGKENNQCIPDAPSPALLRCSPFLGNFLYDPEENAFKKSRPVLPYAVERKTELAVSDIKNEMKTDPENKYSLR